MLRDRAFKDYRAVAPGAGKVTADQIDIDLILDERALELISEENRRMTLVRTNTLAERIKLIQTHVQNVALALPQNAR